MREISQVVAPRLITQGNGPKVKASPTTTKWNKVLPPATSATEPIVLRPYQIEAVQSVGNPSVGGGFSVFTYADARHAHTRHAHKEITERRCL